MDLRPLPRCADCGWRRPARAPECATCRAWVDDDIARAWRSAVHDYEVTADDEPAFAATVVADPRGVEWRVFDAALDRAVCVECGEPLGAGPVGCTACDAAHGWRWLAAEPERPHVPPGNEHAIRVATAVVRVSHRFPEHMVPRYAVNLPLLIAGGLPSGADARAANRWLDHGGDLADLDAAPSTAAVAELVRRPPAVRVREAAGAARTPATGARPPNPVEDG